MVAVSARPDGNAEAWAAMLTSLLGHLSDPRLWRRLSRRDWVELGALVTRAWHDQGEAIRNVVRDRNPGWADQADAAAAESRVIGGVLLEPGMLRAQVYPDDRAEAALRGYVIRVMAGMGSGCLRSCEHASWSRPIPMFTAAWSNRVACKACFDPAAFLARSWFQARYCDLCGETGRRPTTLTTPSLGALTIALGACEGCVGRLVEGPGGVA